MLLRPRKYRSPEEFRGDIVDEKMDVFSMGNNIYVLLTGLFPFYSLNSYEEIQVRDNFMVCIHRFEAARQAYLIHSRRRGRS